MRYRDRVLTQTLLDAVIAGLFATVACGLGVLPLMWERIDPAKHRGLGYGVAGGLMFAASVYNLILPGLRADDGQWNLGSVTPIVTGILLGALFLTLADRALPHGDRSDSAFASWGGRLGLLVFLAMTVHSIPEGVAVGVGYVSDETGVPGENLGPTLALAIAIHNIPEGLAVAIPMRSAGATIRKCFWAAMVTSLPQPIAAVPAVLLAWFFQPIMPLLMGFAAGAMIFLVLLDLIPEALNVDSPLRITWAFTIGFCVMLLVQVVL